MPEYAFTDKNGHQLVRVMSFEEYGDGMPVCPKCGEEMHRRYEAPSVVWGGLKPSQGEYSPEMQSFFGSADRRRAEFEKEHEAHEHQSA